MSTRTRTDGKVPEAQFTCASCGETKNSYRFVKGKDIALANFDLWTKKRTAYTLCAICSRVAWNDMLTKQPIGSQVSLILHNGIAENVTHSFQVMTTNGRFQDSGGGVWKAVRLPSCSCARTKFVKVSASKPT
jgi:hypothetical protein